MKRLRFLWRITERYLSGHRSDLGDIASDYDLASTTYAETWQAFMEPVSTGLLDQLELPNQGSVPDLGCGTGLVLEHLRQHGFRGSYCGIDASPGMLTRVPLGPGVELRQGDVHDAIKAIPGRSIDGVTALWSWEYMDRMELLPSIRRVLRPGGRVLLLANRRDTVPELEGAFLRLMTRHPREIEKVFHQILRMPRSAAQMVRELSRSGFETHHRVEGERVRSHASAAEAIAWGFRTGALAGTRCVLRLPDLEVRLAEMMFRQKPAPGAFTTTHRFAGVAGVRPC